jgi:hypothetical protein
VKIGGPDHPRPTRRSRSRSREVVPIAGDFSPVYAGTGGDVVEVHAWIRFASTALMVAAARPARLMKVQAGVLFDQHASAVGSQPP